jgi:Peptidase S24-like
VLRFVRVRGVSMSPALGDGDFVLVASGRFCGPARVGSVVLVAHPQLGMLLKRIVAHDCQRRVKLQGDNALSIASEDLGYMPADSVAGKAILRIARSGAITRIRRC